MQQERRYFDRTPLKLSLLLKIEDGTVLDAEMKDLGAKGLGIVSKERIPPEVAVKLKVAVPEKDDFYSLDGNVIWSKEFYPDGWRAGVALKEQSVNLVAFSVLQDMLKKKGWNTTGL